MRSFKYESVTFSHVKVTEEMMNAVSALSYQYGIVHSIPCLHDSTSSVGVDMIVHESDLAEEEAQGDKIGGRVARIRKAMQVLFSYQGDVLDKQEGESENLASSFKSYRFIMEGGGTFELTYWYE